jgi:hypothetical protein
MANQVKIVIDRKPDIVVSVKSCARCGGDHSDMPFFLFSGGNPPTEFHVDHWGMCPELGEPLFLAVTHESEF